MSKTVFYPTTAQYLKGWKKHTITVLYSSPFLFLVISD